MCLSTTGTQGESGPGPAHAAGPAAAPGGSPGIWRHARPRVAGRHISCSLPGRTTSSWRPTSAGWTTGTGKRLLRAARGGRVAVVRCIRRLMHQSARLAPRRTAGSRSIGCCGWDSTTSSSRHSWRPAAGRGVAAHTCARCARAWQVLVAGSWLLVAPGRPALLAGVQPRAVNADMARRQHGVGCLTRLWAGLRPAEVLTAYQEAVLQLQQQLLDDPNQGLPGCIHQLAGMQVTAGSRQAVGWLAAARVSRTCAVARCSCSCRW
jgi:hypothetical protein